MQGQDRGQPDWGGPFREFRQSVQITQAVVQIVSMPLCVWTRRFGTWGERFASFHMLLGWIFVPVFGALFFPKDNLGPLMAAWLLTALMLMLHRLQGWWLRKFKGYWVPSQYSGESWIPGSEWAAKGTWEPFAAVCLGGGACFFSAPLGAWLIVAGIAQGFAVGFARDEEKAIIRAARDARARAQYEMEFLRKELGEE
jgi:hypothetical protein